MPRLALFLSLSLSLSRARACRYDSVSLDDIKQFRQIDSCTPGHPENFETPGVEVTTGPLGQGISQAVGLALAEKHLAARFNKPDCTVVDHYTYVIMGDGCCQEGVANEAASLAGAYRDGWTEATSISLVDFFFLFLLLHGGGGGGGNRPLGTGQAHCPVR